MKRVPLLTFILLISSILIYSGCKKEEDPVPPTISFKTDHGYISTDAALKYGDTLTIGIIAKSNGTDNLVKFQIYANEHLMLDSTINTLQFSIGIASLKSVLDREVWKFVTTDIAGNTTADSIVITGDFGEINTYSSILLGAQNNTTEKGFLSLSNSTSTTYTMDEAFNHQADIDMFCFYENTSSHVNLMTLAAPGSNITGIFSGATSPENYTEKNVTYFVKTTLSTAEFEQVSNDAVILASWDTNNKFKKAKMLQANDVYAFMLQSGKYGLFKVNSVAGVEDGTVTFTVKIQK